LTSVVVLTRRARLVVLVSAPRLLVRLWKAAAAASGASRFLSTPASEFLETATEVSRVRLTSSPVDASTPVAGILTWTAFVLLFEEHEVLLTHELRLGDARSRGLVFEVPFVLLLETAEGGLFVIIEQIFAKPVRFDLSDAAELRPGFELKFRLS
jgi:hypothetical protein